MIRVRYMFWAMALFLIGGCGKPETMWVYRWDVLREEIPAVQTDRTVFGSPELAAENIYGVDEVAGVSLNQRYQPRSTAGYADEGEVVRYYLYYHDRQGPGFDGCGYRRGACGRHDLRRSFSYEAAGQYRR